MSAPDHGPYRSRRFLLLLKGRPHMSQSLEMAVKGAGRGRTFRGEPSLKTAPIRPFLGLLTNFATGFLFLMGVGEHGAVPGPVAKFWRLPYVEAAGCMCASISGGGP